MFSKRHDRRDRSRLAYALMIGCLPGALLAADAAGQPPALSAEQVAVLDQDADGAVSMRELFALMRPQQDGTVPAALDTDGDGRLSALERRNVMRAVHGAGGQRPQRHGIARNPDATGPEQRSSAQAARTGRQDKPSAVPMGLVRVVVSRADGNKDGVVDATEWQALFDKLDDDKDGRVDAGRSWKGRGE